MDNNTWSERTIALSAVFQAASLVDTLSKTGRVDSQGLQVMTDSLFVQNPEKAIDVYGSINNLHIGINALDHVLKRKQTKKLNDVLRYVMNVLHLQKKLTKNKEMLNIIANRLNQASKQIQHFGSIHDNVTANLAGIYTDTISTFRFRIQVTGDYNHLQQQHIANKIRLLLFSGIRAAVLWQQLGGSRLQLIFYRRHLIKCLQNFTS